MQTFKVEFGVGRFHPAIDHKGP